MHRWRLGPVGTDALKARLTDGKPIMKSIPKLLDEAEERGGAHADNLSMIGLLWLQDFAETLPDTVSTRPWRSAALPRKWKASSAPPAPRTGPDRRRNRTGHLRNQRRHQEIHLRLRPAHLSAAGAPPLPPPAASFISQDSPHASQSASAPSTPCHPASPAASPNTPKARC